jgi:hypothetical protein
VTSPSRRRRSARPRLPRTALVALVLAGFALPVAAARADGPRTPFVVARGHSLFGAPWGVRFGEERGYGAEPAHATILFSVGTSTEADEYEGGYYSSIPVPLPRSFTFSAIFGSDFDRFEEADLAGTAGPLVARLVAKMADGSAAEAELLRAPARLIKTFPSLSRFRFFDLFFPAAAEPVSISVYNRAGKLLQRRRGPAAPHHG